ncbi:hypothetical protein ACFE04_030816 [Oxalis oulophora]
MTFVIHTYTLTIYVQQQIKCNQRNFTWVGSRTPGFVAARAIFDRFIQHGYLQKNGFGDVTATTKLFNLIESSVKVRCKLSPMGPFRILEEEFLDIILESPKFAEATKPFRDAVAKGLTIPLGKHFNAADCHF